MGIRVNWLMAILCNGYWAIINNKILQQAPIGTEAREAHFWSAGFEFECRISIWKVQIQVGKQKSYDIKCN